MYVFIYGMPTLGMRVIPPTKSTSVSSSFFTPESFKQVLQGPTQPHFISHAFIYLCMVGGGHTERFLHQVVDEIFELGLGESDVEMLGALGIGRDEGQRHLRRREPIQLPLRLLGSL